MPQLLLLHLSSCIIFAINPAQLSNHAAHYMSPLQQRRRHWSHHQPDQEIQNLRSSRWRVDDRWLRTFIHLRENASRVEQFGLQVISSIGAGMLFPARLLATQAAQDAADIPKVAATMTFTSNLGQCFGIPIGATTHQSMWDTLVGRDVKAGLIPDQYIITSHDAEESAELIRQWPHAVTEVYRHIMAVSISKIWIVITVLCGFIFLMGVLMKEVPLLDGGEAESVAGEPKTGLDDTARLIGP